MDEQKKMFTNKSVTLFLVIVISVSAIFETIVIALRAMGLAVFLMWVPTIAAIIAGCISQKESNGKISFKKLLQSIGFQKTSIKWILLSCLIPAVYIGIPYVLFWIAFPNSLDMSKASVIQLVLMSVVGIFIGLITAIGEEIGWRGYLVPATLERVGIKKALIYTSIFWGVWHLPILISGLYMPGTPAWYSVPAFLFMIIPVGMIYPSYCRSVAVVFQKLSPRSLISTKRSQGVKREPYCVASRCIIATTSPAPRESI